MSAPHENRLRHAGVGEPQGPGLGLPDAAGERNKVAVNLPLEQDLIQFSKHVGRRELQRREAAQDAPGHRAVQRRRRAFAAHVAYRDDVPVAPVSEKIVKVTA